MKKIYGVTQNGVNGEVLYAQAEGTSEKRRIHTKINKKSNHNIMKSIYSFIFLVLLAVIVYTNDTQAQSTANYSFTTNATGSLSLDMNGNTVDMSTGTTTLVSGPSDAGVSSITNIGFTFYLMGIPYTQFSAKADGLIGLGSVAVSGTTISGGSSTTPLIGPFAGDLYVGTAGKVHYKLVGSAPNRCLVVEYNTMAIFYSTTAANANSTFQVRLYEASGIVEFVYGRMNCASTSFGPATLGFTSGTATNTIASITSSTNTVSNSTVNTNTYVVGDIANLNSTADGSRRVYRFSPPAAPSAPSNLTFTSIGTSTYTLNWTDNSTNETGFAIWKSTDGINYNYIGNVASNTISYTATGLSANTTYYWQVAAINEGAISSYITGSQSTNTSSPLSGTKYVGTGTNPMDYATLTIAFSEINANTLSGNLNLVLNTTYTTTDASFPIAGPTASAVGSYTVTIYPSVTGLSITSASSTGTLNLNGSKNIVIDGRVGATGSTKDLTIANTSTTGYTVQFINDATYNTIKYTTIKGVTANTSSGVLLFSTTTGTTGNDNNTIDNCDIRDGATTPYNCIYSVGSTTTTAAYNSNNTISNCNIYNFFYAAGAEYGIYLGSGNTDWTVTGNSIYQTSTRTETTAGTDIGIYITNSGNNFNISNNYIGGSSPNCGGTAWTIAGTIANRFRGISLSVGTTTASSIQGNTIANFNFTSNSSATTAGGAWTGIYLTGGYANIGNITGNTIGSGSGTGSISITMATNSGGISSGIYCDATSTVSNISNNTIGSITQASTTIGGGIYGIVTTAGTTLTINNNTIGSTGTSNSLNTGAYTGATAVLMKGIYNTSSATISITNNTIANLTNGYLPSSASTSNLLSGIQSSSGVNTISGNTVRNLTTAANATGTTSGSSVIGIYMSSTTAGTTISQNVIHSLTSTHASAATSLLGIYYNGATTGTNIVSRNFIHSLSLSSTSSAGLSALYAAGGTTSYHNNMIRLGVDPAGNSITTPVSFVGLSDGLGTNNYYFNSVFIGGSGVTGTANTYCFNSTVTTNTRNFQNNIFYNSRSNGTGTGKHYAVKVSGTGVNPTGLTINYNDYLANGTGAVFGYYNADVADLSAWKTAIGQDVSSNNSDPQFINPTGTSSTVDLHISATNPTIIEGNGFAIGSVTDDYDGQTRSGLTPTDIGADAGNFTPFGVTNPASFTATTASSSQINLSFTPNGSSNNVVIVWNSSGTFTTPSGTPVVGNTLANGTVLSIGTSSPVNHTGLSSGTVYYYKAFSYDGANYSLGITSNATTLNVPTLTSIAATNILYTTATTGGNVSSDGGSTITERGVCYSINANPTTSDSKVTASGTTGSYSCNLTGLSYSTTYHFRAYANNSVGTAYGSDLTFTTGTPVSSFPWTENFDAMGSIGTGVFPSYWKSESPSGTPWASMNAASITYNDPSSLPNYITCSYSPSSSDKYLITPGFSLTAGNTYSFSFKWAGDGLTGWTGDVRYNTSQTGTASTQIGSAFVSSSTTTSSTYATVSNNFVAPSTALYYFIVHVNNTNTPWYLGFDDFSVTKIDNMAYSSTSATQPLNTTVGLGSVNQQMMQIQVITTGTASPLSATQFSFSTKGTDRLEDLAGAKLYYTGTSSTFSTTTIFGTAGSLGGTPGDPFYITGTQTLASGTNYFWLTYDISATGNPMDIVNADYTGLTVSGTGYTYSYPQGPGRQITDDKYISSVSTSQASTSNISKNTSDNEILMIDFNVSGTTGTLPLNSMVVNYTGTSATDIGTNGVKLYRTTTPTFSTANMLGSAQSIVSGNVTFNSLSYDLPNGHTYVWVAFDVPSTATAYNTVDAQILANQIDVNGLTYPSTTQNPSGSRNIYPATVNPPYAQTFEGAASFGAVDWRVTNAGTGNNWTIATTGGNTGPYNLKYSYNATYAANTWAFLPPINLTSGNSYTIEYYEKTGGGYTEKMKVTVGNDATVAAQTTTLQDLSSLTNTTYTKQSITYNCTSTGVYYFAFNCYSAANQLTLYVDDINVYANLPMTYVSSTTTQNLNNLVANTTNQQIIGIQVVTTGTVSPLSMTDMQLSTNGTTDPATDITNAKLYYTGTSSTFTTGTQFGSTVASPNGSFTISGTQSLSQGTNYFWLTYDIPSGAVAGHTVDAECSQLTISASVYTPTITAPSGSRSIVGPLSGTYTIGMTLPPSLKGRNIYPKKFTRTVVIDKNNDSPEYDEVQRMNLANQVNEKSIQKEKSNNGNNLLLNSSSFGNTANIKGKIEVQEDYYVLYEGDKPYEGPMFFDNNKHKPPVSLITNKQSNSKNTANKITKGTDLKDRSKSGYETDNTESNGDYLTLDAAILDLNTRGLNGAVTFVLYDTATSTSGITINPSGLNSANTLTIKPASGRTVTITGSSATSIIKINGGDYITIDGSNSGTTSKDLTITNTNTSTTSAVIWIASATASDGAGNNIIKNCIISGNSSTTTLFGIFSGGTASISTTTYALTANSNNIIQNNTISKSQYGILLLGTSTSALDQGNQVLNNILGSSASGDGFGSGIVFAQYQNGLIISGNDMQNLKTSTGSDQTAGIFLTDTKSSTITKNKIHNNAYTGTSTSKVWGIGSYSSAFNTSGNPTGNIFTNNLVYDLSSSSTSGFFSMYGIGCRGGYGDKYYYNSVYISGSSVTGASTAIVAAFVNGDGYIGTAEDGIDVRNNVFYVNASTSFANSNYAFYTTLTSAANITSDYNDLKSTITGSGTAYTGYFNSANRSTLALWQTATGKDAYSFSANPGFTSATNLTPNTADANSWVLSGNGTHIATVTDDFSGASRPSSVINGAPDIGAFEFSAPSVSPNTTTITVTGVGTTNLVVNGRTIGSLYFSNVGSPAVTSVDVKFFTGTVPPGIGGYSGATSMNAYFVITPNAGASGFTYDITYNYSEPQRGTIVNESDIRMSKSEDGGTTWSAYIIPGTGSGQYELNTTLNTIKVYGLNAFSTFSNTDQNAPLPVELASFSTVINGRDITLKWTTEKEFNNAGFEIERKISSSQQWSKIGYVQGKGNSNTRSNYMFEDKKLNSGKYSYRLKQIDNNGHFEYHMLSSEVNVEIPKKYDMSQNYPNPFNPVTKIDYDLPFESRVSIVLYDMTGKEVKTLVNETAKAGYYTLSFNASSLSSGTYFYRITANATAGNSKTMITKKMILVK